MSNTDRGDTSRPRETIPPQPISGGRPPRMPADAVDPKQIGADVAAAQQDGTLPGDPQTEGEKRRRWQRRIVRDPRRVQPI